MTLIELIRKYRETHDISQRQFAAQCGLSNGYISMLERGENPKTRQPIMPTIQALQKLADGMNMSLTSLLSSIDDMPVDLGDIKITATDVGGGSSLDLELSSLILSLSPEKKREAIRYLSYLAQDKSSP